MPYLTEPPAGPLRRVVSLCPSVTDTIHAFSAWDLLVGRTRYCVHPRGLVQAIPHVRGTKNPDLPALFALRPDLVVAVKEENRQEDVALVAKHIPVLLLDPKTVEDAAEGARELGSALNRQVEGEQLARGILRAARAARQAAPAKAPRVVYLCWWDPAMGVGGDTFIHSMLATAGMHDLCGDRERYPTLTPQELAGFDPDAVLLSSEPFPFQERHRAELAEATGLPLERFRLVDGELLSWHGARTVRGLDYAAQLAAALGGPLE